MTILETPVTVGGDNVEDRSPIPPQGGYTAKRCKRAVHLDHDPNADPELKLPPTAGDQRRMDDGVKFETQIGEVLTELLDPTTTVFLTGDRSVESKAAREQATIEAMDAGVQFIWNARIPADFGTSRISEPDALVRIGAKRKPNGKWAYAPIDVKHHKSLDGATKERAWPVSDLSTPAFEDAAEQTFGAGTAQLVDSLQLAHYHRHLETMGYAQDTEQVWGGVIGKERTIVWRDLAEAMYTVTVPGGRPKHCALDMYDEAFAERLEVIDAAVNEDEPLAFAENKTECGSCPWRAVCADELVEADHITLLKGITPLKAQAHYLAGVTKIGKLARLDHRTATVVDAKVTNLRDLVDIARADGRTDVGLATLLGTSRSATAAIRRLHGAGITTIGELAALHDDTLVYAETNVSALADAIDQARVTKSQRVHLRRGIENFDIPTADVEVHIDMENLSDDGGFTTLWGVLHIVHSPHLVIPGDGYQPFAVWDPTDVAGEAAAFAGMWNWLRTLRTLADRGGLSLRMYCYSGAEERLMRHLAAKHAGVPGVPTLDDISALVASDAWVDLLVVIKEQTLWPTPDLGLKSCAKWARFSWRDSDASGDNSMVWYDEASSHPDPEVRSAARERYLQYNEDDVLATAHLVEWLKRLASARNRSDRIPNVSTLDRRYGPRPKRTRKVRKAA